MDALEFAPRAVLYNCSFGVVGWGAWHAVEIGVGEFDSYRLDPRLHTGLIPPKQHAFNFELLGSWAASRTLPSASVEAAALSNSASLFRTFDA